MVEILVDERDEIEIGNDVVLLERMAAVVPESEKFPSGVKYRFHACQANGDLIVRYDNANDAHVAKHHKHVVEDGEEVTKPISNNPETEEGLLELLKQWRREVMENVEE
ncbi:MAG: DUF6516 family protein [Candidatus Nanohalobium sp.]